MLQDNSDNKRGFRFKNLIKKKKRHETKAVTKSNADNTNKIDANLLEEEVDCIKMMQVIASAV